MPTPPTSPARYPCHCLRCGHEWEARKPDTKQCPNCSSYSWRTEPTETDIKKRHKQPVAVCRDALDAWNEAMSVPVEVERLNPKLLTKGGKLVPGDRLFVRERVAL